ncbi:MAG: ABC transporter substrate-binding protein [Alphaproteobacteria bacterium]|nr:ABC transporter substrate-binding protein [Alphaproteobacteria bacterium]MBV9862231.1 ABC transporter substrate-binding protein [Alphaproteobacteria bacterium]
MRRLPALFLGLVLTLAAIGVAHALGTYGMSLFGELKYGAGFSHFDYANPDAPKGGTMRLSAIGTYDTLNPFVVKGLPAAGIGMIFDTLMSPAEDEPVSEYGLAAESAELAPDKLSVLYTLRPEARFHDGTPMTPADVVWTFDTLRDKGAPMYRSYYGDVTGVEPEGDRGVRFRFKSTENRELPQILGEMPVLSKAYWSGREFDKTTLDIPLGSGPYKIEAIDAGRSITYRRVPDYWAINLPVNKGRYNVDVIRYDYYRDATVALEAFKAGQYDYRRENSSKDWATGYDSPALRQGLIKKEEIPNELTSGMQGFGFNLRRPLFQDPRVREALGYAFDFEWSNKNLFYGAYKRTRSYFDNSELAATGVPQGAELQILDKYRGQIPDQVFTTEYNPPKYDGSGNIRDGLRIALRLLKEAGWAFQGEKLVNEKTGQPFEFELLLDNPQFERIVLPFVQNLARMGVIAHVRTIDNAQYERRVDTFDFDMTVVLFPQSLSPGNEQREFFGSAAADQQGSRNQLGIKSPVIDQLIEGLIAAPDRASLVVYCHALDRVLQYGYYVVPNFHTSDFWVAYWDKYKRPQISPKYGLGLETWWVDPNAEKTVEEKKGETAKP